ncbi:MFS transporter, UMF1 family [Palleronia marisminoris]|uniref:Vacuole effluxer Atg22 like protein n=1 Tax=Palleronia marisminoris TaxID=315423 RepID=A0A1Y5SNQ7_9RHOB|nr:MFS transporter [Palleronia marisminoris]SFG84287.1 MFS transporter, UMF1 family [Palleronia marisminoris]SLN41939.1 Vacuole effluxer Atg22 like protein [Palleronia marisminoris]
MQTVERKRIWGWFFFDWASQPYNTLLITFIFGPYVSQVLGDGSQAQAVWGYGIGAAGIVIAILAPVFGAIADQSGRRMPWIWGFSVLYVVGSAALWLATPQDFDLLRTMIFFGIGLIGMEFATIFTNSMLPDLTTRQTIGRISGTGWAFGYLGGLISLILALLFFAEDGLTGTTLLGIEPILGLDPETREGTRFIGPLTAIWYVIFMVPFFLWVREPRAAARRVNVRAALRDLGETIRRLPETPSQLTFLIASMLYRDGLAGAYALGAIFAAGVLDWSVVQTGTFGIIAVISGALFAWIGGRADERFGPKPVIVVSTTALLFTILAAMFVSRDSVFGVPQGVTSQLPDTIFLVIGATIGAAGGALQSASRTMMVRQGNAARMTEAFGLYALTGKATSFIAPLSIGIATSLTGSQHLGVSPLIVLFAVALVLLVWVRPEGDPV